MILYELASGSHPGLKLDFNTYKNAINKNICYPHSAQINSNLRALINSCLKRNPLERITWDEVLKNEFLVPFLN